MKKRLFAGTMLLFLFMACDMFNAPMDPFIEEHTARVTVASLDVTGAVLQPTGNGYLISGSDVEMYFIMNNTAGLELDFTVDCFINGTQIQANTPGGRFVYDKISNFRVHAKISGITSNPGEQIAVSLKMQTENGIRVFPPYSCPAFATSVTLLEEVAAMGGTKYSSLSAALDAAPFGSKSAPVEITLLKNISFPERSSSYTINGKHIKLIGGSYTVTHKTGDTNPLFAINAGSLVLENITLAGNGADGNNAIKLLLSGLTMGTNAVIKDFSGPSTNGAVFVPLLSTFTMTENAVIKTNTMDKGGAVYIDGGLFTMEGGSITGNSANQGGGVYMNYGVFTMSGGMIGGSPAEKNTATSGHGAYMDGGIFNMSGAARISGNDLYLVTGKFVSPTALSGSGIVAVITPQSYSGSPRILSDGIQRSRFSVTPNGTTFYFINGIGLLASPSGGIGYGEILYGTDGPDIINVPVYIDGTIDAGGGDDTITVGGMNPSGIINAGEGDNTVIVSATVNGTISTGNGNDTITIGSWFQSGNINSGSGSDTIDIKQFATGSIIDVGADAVMDTVIIRDDSNGILEINNFDPGRDKLKLKPGWSANLSGGYVEITVSGSGKIKLPGVTDTSYSSYIGQYP
ncbi:MAG: hypothetical protein LBI67_09255 [Treponema sp.]|nr:hypothetical protein [Treponema sp.]